jgi:signal transduction histidine kinase
MLFAEDQVLQGQITVESREGEGITFVILLPVEQEGQA